MSPERWKQIERLLDSTLELEPKQWNAFLDDACSEDPELRRDVESLLARRSSLDSFLAGPPAVPATEREDRAAASGSLPPEVGRQIGSFRLIREIGRGGMGRVFLAERADGSYERRVALKLLRPELERDDAVRRFRAETQILAGLEHPRIARLIDAGVDDGERPYLVMEYVEGEAIDEFAARRRLSMRDRLRLFLQVLDAVQHAHANLIVHRDIKPSNILVTGGGSVKLLDFGLARLLDSDAGSAAVTRTGTRWMTPEYAAPEQIGRRRTTTATDVYQLGAVLYELLSGRRPFEDDLRSLHEIEQAVLTRTPARPSSLDRELRGDLDAIVLKALRKEPAARYRSAEAMKDDLERHLRGLPVTARRGSTTYRIGLFLRRHRWGVAMSGAFAASLVGFAAVHTLRVTQERDLARLEAAKSAQVTGFLIGLFEASDPRETGGDAVTARELLSRGLDRIESLEGQPGVQAQMFDAVGSVYRSLGRYDEALPLLERALAMRRDGLGDGHPDVAASLASLAGLRQDRGEYAEAEDLYREALQVQRRLLGREHADVAATLNGLGSVLKDRGDYEDAEVLYRAALRIQRRLLGEKHVDVAATLNNFGLLLMEMGDSERAETVHRQALAMRRELLGNEHLDLTYSLNNLALVLHQRGDFVPAESLYREVLALDRKLLGETHPDFALDLNNLGGLLKDRGDLEGAEALYRQSLALQREQLGETHPRVGQVLNNLAALSYRKGDYEAAEPLYREALAIRRASLGEDHPAVATVMSNLAVLLRDKDDLEAAEPLMRDALAIRRTALGNEHADVAMSLRHLASLRLRAGAHEEASALFQEAIAVNETAMGEGHWLTAYFRSELAESLTGLARYAEAEPLLLEADSVLRAERGEEDEYAVDVRKRLTALYEVWEEPDQAAAHATPSSGP